MQWVMYGMCMHIMDHVMPVRGQHTVPLGNAVHMNVYAACRCTHFMEHWSEPKARFLSYGAGARTNNSQRLRGFYSECERQCSAISRLCWMK